MEATVHVTNNYTPQQCQYVNALPPKNPISATGTSGHLGCSDNSYGCSGPYIDCNNSYQRGDFTDPVFQESSECVNTGPRRFTNRNINRVKPNGLLAKLALPCQTVSDYDYNECYSYYANGCYNTCQFVKFGDMEDFMNNEKRKEKSRDAARSRRSRETEIFTDLANALPLTQEQVSQLDKASIMRLAISFLKVRDMIKLVPDVPVKEEENKELLCTDESAFLKSLEGFLVVFSTDGDFIYLSENVSDYLGIAQIDLMGQNVFEYSHPCDHDEIKEILSGKAQDDCDAPKSFFIRLKCTLTSKGRSVNLKSATYKVIHCTGHILKYKKCDNEEKSSVQSCLVAVGQPIPHPSNIEAPLPRQTFLTKHSLDMKFTHADDKIMMDILGYNSDDLIGKSVYEYHHALDSDSICSAYKCLFSKGQCETNRYRFLAKTGGYVWVVTQATLIYDKIQKPQSVVCVNYVVSGVECKDEIYSASQYASYSAIKSECSTSNTNNSTNNIDIVIPVVEKTVNQQSSSTVTTQVTAAVAKPTPITSTQLVIRGVAKPVIITENVILTIKDNIKKKEVATPPFLTPPYTPPSPPSSKPQTATTKIFVTRTEDMNKGFLTFMDGEPGRAIMKDEPEDLTHLAPEAGDECVPLDTNPFLSDMLDEILLRDNFGPLLNDDPTDPFISYRDFHDPSPQLLSPNFSKNSECSLPSLNSPSDSLVDEDQMSTFMNLQMDDDTDLAMKAPYIPMNTADDLPLLLSNDLMWSSSNKTDKSVPDCNSSLAQLLSSSVNQPIKANDHGGGLIPETSIENLYNEKNSTWNLKNNSKNNTTHSSLERTASTKRSNSTTYDSSNKRTRNEPKDQMSSELLQQLMSNNHHRGRPKGKSNWLLDSGGQKAACISQPSDSVLMNLLDDPMEGTNPKLGQDLLTQKRILVKVSDKDKEQNSLRNLIRKNSISLLDPDASAIASLLDLSQQDIEVNAPVSCLLQGEELRKALEANEPI